jgi:hypothetical protein
MVQENLLFSVLEEKNSKLLHTIRDVYLTKKYEPQFTLVKDYFAKYGNMPDYKTVESHFGFVFNQNNSPAQYWFDELIAKYRETVIETAVVDSARDKNNAIAIFQNAIVEYNSEHDLRVQNYDTDSGSREAAYQERKKTGGITYLSTGNDDFDNFSMGYKRADLWTIAGREGLGKSWLLLRLANWLDAELKSLGIDKPVLIASCEMDNEELTERLDCIRCGIPYGDFLKGMLTPAQEFKYAKYLGRIDSNIKMVDDCMVFEDVAEYMQIYQPAAVFLDGSHQLARSYDWKDVAALTAQMKRTTRLLRTPIVNTTHLKSGKGTDSRGADLDDMAYSKGYTRDSDIVAIMYADEGMELNNQIGLDTVKIRRGSRTKIVYETDFTTMEMRTISTYSGVMSQPLSAEESGLF